MFAEPFQTDVLGHVDRIDDKMARVFIGDHEEEWFFPLGTLPNGATVGSQVLFSVQDGRYTALSLTSVGESERSITDRLNRPMNVRRTGEMRRVELQAALRVVRD